MTTLKQIKVGTRASPLSLRQTEEMLGVLRRLGGDVDFAVTTIRTRGDRNKEAPLASLGLGIFASEIEEALLQGEIDLAVHSLKDLPSELLEGLTLAAVGERADPRDVLADRWGLPLEELPTGARIGTSSPRRVALLRNLRRDIQIVPIRGNVETRLRKAQEEECDGVVLAAAGLARLEREGEIAQYLPPETFVPAVGQGALAVEVRTGDSRMMEVVAKADHQPTRVAVTAERSFLRAIGGGCKVPITAYGRLEGDRLHLYGMAGTEDGAHMFRAQITFDPKDPEAAGRALAQALLDSGASKIIREERG